MFAVTIVADNTWSMAVESAGNSTAVELDDWANESDDDILATLDAESEISW